MKLDIKNHIINEYIKNNYKNLRQFTEEFGLDYGNLYKALKNGIGIVLASKLEEAIFTKTGKRIFDSNDKEENNNAAIYLSFYDKEVAKHYAIDTEILKENGWSSENLRVMRVTDEGMEPLITDNALILIDISQTEPESGKIYAVQFEDDILIRRVIKIAGSNQYIAKPATFAFIEQNFTKETAKVLGRVVYRMGELL